MSNQMNLIFEPADLEQASPATVSRCGMIYMEPHLLGWKPLMESYVATLEKILLPEQIEILVECTDWLVPPCLEFINNSCKKFVETSDTHLFHVRMPQNRSQLFLHACYVFPVVYKAVQVPFGRREPGEHGLDAVRVSLLPGLGIGVDFAA